MASAVSMPVPTGGDTAACCTNQGTFASRQSRSLYSVSYTPVKQELIEKTDEPQMYVKSCAGYGHVKHVCTAREKESPSHRGVVERRNLRICSQREKQNLPSVKTEGLQISMPTHKKHRHTAYAAWFHFLESLERCDHPYCGLVEKHAQCDIYVPVSPPAKMGGGDSNTTSTSSSEDTNVAKINAHTSSSSSA